MDKNKHLKVRYSSYSGWISQNKNHKVPYLNSRKANLTMNEKIIQYFTEREGSYISGEELSQELQVSRTAVWKHIQSLKEEGYEFEAAPRKGYRLLRQPERLNVAELINGLQAKVMGRKLHVFEEVDSTQQVAHKLVSEGAQEGTLVIAEAQTAGRGRMGRHWHSPRGKGIWMSLVLTPKIPVFYTPQLTLLAAVALCRSIRQICDVEIGIKWPNDLLIKGKKVSGILLETSGEDERVKYVVAGIGISANLLAADYPEDLLVKATSLAIELGHEISRETIIATFLNEFEGLYELYYEQGFTPIRLLWEALSVSLYRPIRIQITNGWVEGIAESIDDAGALTVVTSSGEKIKAFSGDVELRG
jgi:BirA family biotin operon repressor/biotin-[acetyl-CoA-carboxylase] ligase